MRKLRIDLGDLKVDSFEVPASSMADGTVLAHGNLAPSYPDPKYTCQYHCTYIGPTCGC